MTVNRTPVRLAPSSTGLLHDGNARSGLHHWLFARKTDSAFPLRLEHTEMQSSPAIQEPRLIEDLRWPRLDLEQRPMVRPGNEKAAFEVVSLKERLKQGVGS